jgi:hypothetical protein
VCTNGAGAPAEASGSLDRAADALATDSVESGASGAVSGDLRELQPMMAAAVKTIAAPKPIRRAARRPGLAQRRQGG